MSVYGVVYIVTNLVNGKFYVGQTKRTAGDRWSLHKADARRGSTSYFHKAIRKHGYDAFDVQVAATASSREELLRLERLWILATGAHRRGYNLSTGGEGAAHNREVIERMAAKLRGRRLSDAHRAKLSAIGRGRPQTQAHRAARSAALKGRQVPTEACRLAVAEANRRRVCSPETRAKLRIAAQKANQVRWGR